MAFKSTVFWLPVQSLLEWEMAFPPRILLTWGVSLKCQGKLLSPAPGCVPEPEPQPLRQDIWVEAPVLLRR